MKEIKNMKKYYKELENDIYKIKKFKREAIKSSKTTNGNTELTEEELLEVYEVISEELGEVILKKFLNIINLLIEDKKNHILLSEKHNILINELPQIKEDMKNKISQKYTERITSLEKEINSTQNEISELEKSNENLRGIEKQFKEFVICHHLQNLEGLKDESLENILKLYKLNKKLGQSAKKKPENFSKQEIQNNLEDDEKCSYCQKKKSTEALQCSDCKKKINSIRVREGIGMQEARELYGKNKGVKNPLQSSYENERFLGEERLGEFDNG